ncbi:gamma-glutamyl-gamma-aminobutyrate hydrolase family protein [Caldimonas brevitalea]|uniref:gamma-glutamyl-gamma-aminobutyrate hydrolase n=1 Tax=Caldimonas brevitalea TaxID=413882 RepID=A0A0G3BT18_9BURK|nr:gamma-glutamyl-gamma-aminobutyrate hydrolase family protein [Caldimonas brevitalea]AKJ29675.1 gamma-glutamyl-gamma-aminobutyrate hydrolase [Caldimonas brevitalea]
MTAQTSSSSRSRPVVLVPACNKMVGPYPSHVVGKKYVDAVRLAGALPLVVPSADAQEVDELLTLADGVLLTGSPSNVDPRHFGESVLDETLPLDPERDAWTLALIPAALLRGVPLFAICRGLQEANVALGGSLHQAVHELADMRDHREPEQAELEVQYGPAHRVQVQPGGLLASLLGGATEIEVNSLHGQGVKQLGPGLHVEALAPDGLIEAFSNPQASAFNLFVQWHPEWQAEHNPVSLKLFKAFGAACQAYRDRRRDPLT